MVQFRQGMLGVAVVAVAIAGALLGSWAMSMDVEERTVTTYDALTDITPLFDTEMAPAYTDYNPATNYTGYYTESSTIGDHRYFGGVDYTEANRPNNYKVDLPPEGTAEGVADLTGDSVEIDDAIIYFYVPGSDTRTFSKRVSVDAIGALDICSILSIQPKGTLSLSSTIPLSDEWYDSQTTDAIVFGEIGDITFNGFRNAIYQAFDGRASVLQQEYTRTATSAVLNFDTGVVSLYADNDFQDFLRIVSLSEFMVLYSGGSVSLGTTVGFSYLDFGNPSYMEPSRGVEIVQ